MRNYIIKRLLQAIPTLIALSFLIFGLLYITPGDPVYLMLGAGDQQSISPETYEQVRQDLGLDEPFFVRYFDYLTRAFQGDLGTSYITKRDVGTEIFTRMPATIILTTASMLLALLISLPLGIFAAKRHNSIWDSLATFLSTIGVSMPQFWFALLLILLFSLGLGWFPSQGIGYVEDGFGNYLKHLFLPAFSLALSLAATQSRMIRSAMLEVLKQDYMRFARGKGLKEWYILKAHALRNALIPFVTVIGAQFGSLLGGAVIIETIFAWPGVGRLAVNAVGQRDFPMIQGTTLVLCVFFLLVNLLVDIICAWLNPKIRLR